MIKKSLRAYITRRLFENVVLLTGDAVGFAHFQALEQDVQRGLVVVIILVDFSSGDHFHIGVVLVLIAVDSDVEMLRQQQVRSSLIHVELV